MARLTNFMVGGARIEHKYKPVDLVIFHLCLVDELHIVSQHSYCMDMPGMEIEVVKGQVIGHEKNTSKSLSALA